MAEVASIAIIGHGHFNKPLKVGDFYELTRRVRTPLLFERPVESAYPISLDNPKKYAHSEGVLTLVHSVKETSSKGLEKILKDWIITAAKKIELDYCSLNQKGKEWARENNVPLDFPIRYQQLIANGTYEKRLHWEPVCEILQTGAYERMAQRYITVASDLVQKTRDARIRIAKERAKSEAKHSIKVITNVDKPYVI